MKLKFIITILLVLSSCQTILINNPDPVRIRQRHEHQSDYLVYLLIRDDTGNDSDFSISEEIYKQIERIFPNVLFRDGRNINLGNLPNNSITIIINIGFYRSEFGARIISSFIAAGGEIGSGIIAEGRWNGITAFKLTSISKENDITEKQEKEISEIVSMPNLWGLATARQVLNDSYQKTMFKLINEIEEILIK